MESRGSKTKGRKEKAQARGRRDPRHLRLRCYSCDRTHVETPMTRVDFAMGRLRKYVYVCMECRFGKKMLEHPVVANVMQSIQDQHAAAAERRRIQHEKLHGLKQEPQQEQQQEQQQQNADEKPKMKGRQEEVVAPSKN